MASARKPLEALEAIGFSPKVGRMITRSIGQPPLCHDYGDRPGCLGTPDELFTMRFDDIGEAPIHWCAFCGPEARAMDEALNHALETRGVEFRAELSEVIARSETKRKEGAS